MRIGSLFSGAGGLDLAALQLFDGSSMAWHCEINDAATKVLDRHWPAAPNHGDVTAIDWTQVEPVDVLTGGYPCQPFSTAGQRKGTNDERHLWPHVREAIRRIRPRYTLLENVAGHRTLGFDRVLADLAADGMHAWWASVRASDVGAAHHRERVFILVADPDGVGLGQGPGQPGTGAPEVPTDLGGVGAFSDPTHDRRERCGTARQRRPGSAHGDPGIDWGTYAPAVRRWERLTCPAPEPTVLNANGRPHLSAAFAEWMMGLPSGWVTAPEIGLTRGEQLRIIGNGVVPAQAVAAFTQLLAAISAPLEGVTS